MFKLNIPFIFPSLFLNEQIVLRLMKIKLFIHKTITADAAVAQAAPNVLVMDLTSVQKETHRKNTIHTTRGLSWMENRACPYLSNIQTRDSLQELLKKSTSNCEAIQEGVQTDDHFLRKQ